MKAKKRSGSQRGNLADGDDEHPGCRTFMNGCLCRPTANPEKIASCRIIISRVVPKQVASRDKK